MFRHNLVHAENYVVERRAVQSRECSFAVYGIADSGSGIDSLSAHDVRVLPPEFVVVSSSGSQLEHNAAAHNLDDLDSWTKVGIDSLDQCLLGAELA